MIDPDALPLEAGKLITALDGRVYWTAAEQLTALITIRSLLAHLAQITEENKEWKTWGTIEIAIRNPNVSSYMNQWEGRALKAESTLAQITQEREELARQLMYKNADITGRKAEAALSRLQDEGRVLPDVEVVSARVHEAWMESKRAQGITSRKSERGEELMVSYTELSEAAKDLDRGSVCSVYAAIKEADRLSTLFPRSDTIQHLPGCQSLKCQAGCPVGKRKSNQSPPETPNPQPEDI